MAEPLAITIPGDVVKAVKELLQEVLRHELAEHSLVHEDGFLDVDRAAVFLASTPGAVRSLVKRDAIPFHKAPNGRLLFDRDELRSWVLAR